jgi:membrane associated rhomboid family serine protease
MVFIISLSLPTPMLLSLYRNLSIVPSTFFIDKKYISLITYQFLHLNFQHLVSNMFVLFSIGRAVESEIGSTKFGITYIIAGTFSGFFHIVFNQSSEISVIGASGAVFGAIALLLLLLPFKFTAAMIVPVPGVVLGITMLIFEVGSMFFSSDVWVAHDIHLYGFFMGGLASFGIDYNRALRGLFISILVLLLLYYWAFHVEGIVI